MIGWGLLLFGLVVQWLFGAALATLILGRRIWRPSLQARWWTSRAELIGLGIVLGIAGTSYAQFLWGLAGGPLTRSTSIGWGVLGSLAGIAAWGLSRAPRPAPLGNDDQSAWVRFAATIVVLLFVSLLGQTLLTPQRLWDERAIFGLKSIVLFEDAQLQSPDLLHPDFVQYHPRYPMLIPLAEQHIYALLGSADDRWAKLLFPLMSLGMVLTFAGVLQRQLRAATAWLWTLVLATVPILAFNDYGFLSAQADAPVACYHGISLLYLWSWLRTRRKEKTSDPRPLILAGAAASMTLFTKDEGIALAIIDGGLLCLLVIVMNWGPENQKLAALKTALGWTGLFAVTTLLIAAPWFLYRGRLPTTTEMNYSGRVNMVTLMAGLGTLSWSVPHMLGAMFLQVTTMGLQWWGLLIAGATQPRRALRPEQLLLLGDVLGALAALLVVGMIAPTPVEEHIGGSSHRFLMQLSPVAVLFIAGQWSRDE